MARDNDKVTDADTHATDTAADDHGPSPQAGTSLNPGQDEINFVPFNETEVLFPNDVNPSTAERRQYIIAEFNLVKRRMKEEEDKYWGDDGGSVTGEQSTTPTASDASERSGLEKIEIGKSTIKGWRKLLEAPINFTWERPGLSEPDNNNAHFAQNQQDVAIMYAFHEHLEAGQRDRCKKKGRLAKAILAVLDEDVMDDILASPPASDSSATTDSPGSRSNTGGSSGSRGSEDGSSERSDEDDGDDYESASSGSGSYSSDSEDDRLTF